MKVSLKICWDVLEHIILMPSIGDGQPRWIYYDDVEERIGHGGEYFESETPCKECGHEFLKKKNSKPEFCSDECKDRYKEKHTTSKGPDGRLKENGGGWYWKENAKDYEPWNKGLKTGLSNGLVNYDRNKESLSWFVEVRRDPIDSVVLQTKCCICGKWFSPSIDRAKDVKEFVYGHGEKSSWGFYCSDECRNVCPYYGKTITSIMKQDHLNGPSAKYSEKHSISDKILYYCWQEDLKKEQNILRNKLYKQRERSRRYRRKKTKREKERMTKKRAKKKIQEDPRTPRLKRMLYLSKHRAKQKKWEHDLDFEWIVENISGRCPRCGIEYDFYMERNMNPWAPSIDRIDHNKGYTKDNCIIVSWMYNCGKNSYDEETLYNICKAFLETFDHDTIDK